VLYLQTSGLRYPSEKERTDGENYTIKFCDWTG